MRLQQILFPNREICDEVQMYYNGKDFAGDSSKIIIKKGGVLDGDTYFNSFSIKKWNKYTKLDKLKVSLDVEGKCKLSVCYAWIDKDNIIRRKGDNIVKFEKKDSARETVTLEFDKHPEGVVAYFRIAAADEDVTFHGGYYETDASEIAEVKLAIGICTFKREEFIEKNLKSLKDNIINNPKSILYNKLDVFISDNGQTLDLNKTNEAHVSCVYNANLGGSGGFTRCMIEAKKARQKNGYTHILLMDDDILLDTSVVERTYAVLTLLKPEYKNSMIGGAMLILNDKKKQFENGALYHGGMLKFDNKNMDLRSIRNIIKNESPHDINYNAWCYCCMPLDKITDDNLPLPFFIHMDDVEYGVRNKFNIITMNGIGVWHPFFANQRGASIVYYDVRNKLITMSEMGGMHIADYARFYLNVFYKYIFNYDYNRTMVACKAIMDYCKGIDAFKNIDPLALHKELAAYNGTWEDAPADIESRINKDRSVYYVSRKGLIKNYLLPAKYDELVMDGDISAAYPFRCKKLVIYNRVTNKCCVYEKSFFKMMKAKRACKKAEKAIKKQILKSSWEWNSRLGEITSLEFWNKYLGI